MPVTAKLSRQFYEKLGDEVTNELVEWLNAMDAASRDQIRELNESNWRRFEARFDAFRAEIHAEMEAFRAEVRGELNSFRVELHAFKAEMVKWMFLFWVGTVASLGGLMYLLTERLR